MDSFELNNNNFVVKMEDKNGDKNVCIYRKIGIGERHKRTKRHSSNPKCIHTHTELFSSTEHSIVL